MSRFCVQQFFESIMDAFNSAEVNFRLPHLATVWAHIAPSPLLSLAALPPVTTRPFGDLGELLQGPFPY